MININKNNFLELQQLSKFLPFELVLVLDLTQFSDNSRQKVDTMTTKDKQELDLPIIKECARLIIDFMIGFFQKYKKEKMNIAYFYNFGNKTPTTSLYTRIGWYCILNIKNNTFYIGSSTQIGKRKQQHESHFKDYFTQKDTMLLKTLVNSIQEDNVLSDFIFIPFTITFSELPIEFGKVKNKMDPEILREFLDLVEFNIIEFFKNHVLYHQYICNEKMTNQFVMKNTFGQISAGGSPKQGICEQNGPYAWTSITECANYFGFSKAVIINRMKKNKDFRKLTSTELDSWDKNFLISKKNGDHFGDEIRKNLFLKYKKRNNTLKVKQT